MEIRGYVTEGETWWYVNTMQDKTGVLPKAEAPLTLFDMQSLYETLLNTRSDIVSGRTSPAGVNIDELESNIQKWSNRLVRMGGQIADKRIPADHHMLKTEEQHIFTGSGRVPDLDWQF